MTAQIERGVQSEIVLRSRMLPVLAIPVPNAISFPRATEAERRLFARVVAQMKRDGMLEPGALDLACFWRGGGGILEIKRPATNTLLGRSPAGRLSDDQKRMIERAEAIGVHHGVAHSWDEACAIWKKWGAL